MKVISSILAVLVLFTAIASICFADEIAETTNESEVVGAPEIVTTDNEQSGNAPIYINDYDDYINAVSDAEVPDEVADDSINQELKNYYDEYQAYLKDYYDNYERAESNKAKVVEAGKSKEEYQLDYQTYSISKYIIQPIKVEILDGEYSGEQVDIDYVLTADSLNNIVLSEVKKGDTVFVSVSKDENGGLTATITNTWSTVERINKVLIIGIILAILLLIYGGKKGFSTALVCILALIFATFIIPNCAFGGNGVLVVGILEMICLIITLSVIHLGTNKNAFKAIAISSVLTAVAALVIMLLNYLTRTVGVSFEYAAIAENIILKNIDFVHLYYITTLIIAAVFVTNTVCMAVKRIERESAFEYDEKVRLAREALPGNIIPLIVTAFTLYLPNHILLLSNKFGEQEIINSETLISELIRVIVVAFCIVIAVPIVSLDVLGFGKKYLTEPKKDE